MPDWDGSNPTIYGLSIEGHPDAGVILLKERSDTLVKCYEGSFSGDQEGTWNVIVKGSQLQGLVKSGNITTLATGLVAADQTTVGEVSSGATFYGEFVKNMVSGKWKNETNNPVDTGSWQGMRTY